MGKDPAFLFYPGDYLRDTQCLSEKTQVAYDRIMCEHMRNICISKQQLNFFTKRLSIQEREELVFVLEETKEGYQIPWVASSIIKRRTYSDSRRKNREGKKKKISKHMKTYVNHMENENENENKDTIVFAVESLNSRSGKNYKSNNKKTIALINARINDGFKRNDFYNVIELKCKEWLGTDMDKYLRPETLFGTKFESYLNSNGKKNNVQQTKIFDVDAYQRKITNEQ